MQRISFEAITIPTIQSNTPAMETPYSIFTQYGLRSGRLGESLLLLLGDNPTDASRAEGQGILNGVLHDYRKMPKGVSHGRWGLVPTIDILVRNGLIEPSKYWDSVITAQTKEMLFLSYGATPVKINAEDDFIAECVICASAYSALHDSLERLCMLERMIALVDELEQLLLTDLTPYTGSARLNARQLHSMLHFLRRMDSLGAYPVKTRKVMGILARYSKDAGIPDDADGRLLRHLLGELPLPEAVNDDMRFFHMLYGLERNAEKGNTKVFSDIYKPEYLIGETILPIHPDADGKRLLNDLTILMTLRVDSAERLRNFKTCVSFLLANTDATIIVTEADTEPRGDIFPDEARVQYSFVKDTNPIFHRTRYMNSMLRECPTPYAALWDIDAIGDPCALATCVKALNSTGAVMAYPYNGRFWGVTDFFSEAFSRTLDMRTLTDEPQPRHLMAGYHSVGGAFVVNVRRYRELGWENENFGGWGPEDMERYRRLEICGCRPLRIDADLYHLGHPRGINSSATDPGLAQSTKEEFIKICAMTHEQLREYISTWEWTQ